MDDPAVAAQDRTIDHLCSIVNGMQRALRFGLTDGTDGDPVARCAAVMAALDARDTRIAELEADVVWLKASLADADGRAAP